MPRVQKAQHLRTSLLAAAILMACHVVHLDAAQYNAADLNRLLALAQSQTASERMDAARGLGWVIYPGAASDALVALLTDSQWFVRSAAADSLRSRTDPKTAAPLERALAVEKDPRVREHLTDAIALVKSTSAYHVFALSDPDPNVRAQTAKDVAYRSDPAFDAPLARLLGDPVPAVRAAAAESLLIKKNPALIDYELQVLRSDSNDAARGRAIAALGQLKARAAVEVLLRIVEDPKDVLKAAAVSALGEIGDPRSAQPIVDSMSYMTSGSWYEIAVALRKLGDPGTTALIGALKRNDESVRIDAARGLGVIKDARAVGPLIALLNDPVDTVRGAAAGSLGDIGDAAAVKPLEDALQARAARSNAAVVVALGRLQGSRAVPTLVRQLGRPASSDESTAILRMLGEFGGPASLDTVVAVVEGRFASSWRFEDLDRQYAGEALGAIGGNRADSVLYAALNRQDIPVIQGGARYFIAMGRDGSDVLLVRALNSGKDGLLQLAELYAASGNSMLVSAASAWAAGQHSTVRPASYKPVKWKQGSLPK